MKASFPVNILCRLYEKGILSLILSKITTHKYTKHIFAIELIHIEIISSLFLSFIVLYILYGKLEATNSKAKITNTNNNLNNISFLTSSMQQYYIEDLQIAKKLQIDKIYAELLPQDKVKIIEKLLSKKSKNQTLAFVGDGINDAPVLARADVGIAMGSLGSDAAIEAADIVIMTDEPYKIIEAINISKRTFFIAKQNAIFATGVKFFVLIFGAFGAISMWTAIFADVGVTILAILNAFRANKKSF